MKNKNMIFTLIAIVFCLLMILPMVLTMFSYRVNDEIVSEYTLFDSYENLVSIYENGKANFQSFWAVLTMISVIGVLASGVLFAIVSMMQLANNKKIWATLKKAASCLIALFFVTLLLGTLLFVAVNTFTTDVVIAEVVHGMTMEVGSYIGLGAALFASIFAFLSCCGKKSKTKKRK